MPDEEIEQVRAMSQEDLQAFVDELKGGGEGEAKPSYVLVAAEAKEDRVATAQTFQFLGLKSGANNFFNLPVGDAKTSLPLGEIKTFGSGDDAVGKLPLSGDIFNFSDGDLARMAAVSGTLKGIKNAFMNGKGPGYYQAEPFFVFEGPLGDTPTVLTPEALVYNGYGIYMRAMHAGVAAGALCKSGAAPTTAVQLEPPASTKIWTYKVGRPADPNVKAAFGASDHLSNADVDVRDEGAGRCGSAGFTANNMFYAGVQDVASEDLSFNWGGNGEFKAWSAVDAAAPAEAGIPPGIWTLKIDGATAASFDLKSAEPVDGAGKPLVFLPKLTVTTTTTGGKEAITSIKVEIFVFDRSVGEGGAFVQVDNVALFRGLIEESPTVGLDDYGGDANNGHVRNSIGIAGTVSEDGKSLLFAYADAADWSGNPVSSPMYYFGTCDVDNPNTNDDSVAVVDSLVFNYKMFGNAYRIDFRGGCGN